MRLLICGSVNWTNFELILGVVNQLKPSIIIEGEAQGADIMGKKAGLMNMLVVEEYPANWVKFHKAAGPIRNAQMLKEGKPDLVVAFNNDIENSKGTADMLQKAEKAGIPYALIREEDVVRLD